MVCPTCFKSIKNPVIKSSMVFGTKKNGVTIWNVIDCPHCGNPFSRILTRNTVRGVSEKFVLNPPDRGAQAAGAA
jgi:hypothetical protein